MIATTTHANIETDPAALEARRVVAAALALALRDPHWTVEAFDPPPENLIRCAWALAASKCSGAPRSGLSLGEIPPDEADPTPLARWLALPHARRERAYRIVFGHVAPAACPPTETEYCSSKDTTHRAQHLADAAGFYNAFGLEPDRARPERHDHASIEIAFVAFLLEHRINAADPEAADAERETICRDAQQAFLQDHIVWWIPTFARLMEERIRRLLQPVAQRDDLEVRDDIETLAAVGRLLRAWTAIERQAEDIEPLHRIIEPAVMINDPEDDACGECSSCQAPPE
ncbi:MAG: hypothetical protein EA376_13770 [Phycisphaeraceae bacterium]|nr:MAG: hypothetical protein EA376_13770 [Phycisphaeraceae bacterium]